MSAHEFTLVLDRTPSEDELDVLYEAGLDDSTPEFGQRAVPVLHVHRDADSLASAIISAVGQVEIAGFAVVGVRTEDLVTLKTIGARTKRSYEAVRRLANGERGPGGFPAAMSGDGYALYSWTEVARWFAEHYGIPDATTSYDRIVAAADHLVRARHLLGGGTGELSALAS
ncbi:hypothetical protein [Nocardia neocaledoniensis]|uniref:hypothetical protein n=1 Tax=Nocardia neocaledoniensis TaxID=236511 RepID=UPI002458B0C9|nr:hypothetical protein [Nocardia neocaledoniensis]